MEISTFTVDISLFFVSSKKAEVIIQKINKKNKKRFFLSRMFLINSQLLRFRLLQLWKRIQLPNSLNFIQKLNFIFQKWLRHSL